MKKNRLDLGEEGLSHIVSQAYRLPATGGSRRYGGGTVQSLQDAGDTERHRIDQQKGKSTGRRKTAMEEFFVFDRNPQ
jgi:hypothetical protein